MKVQFRAMAQSHCSSVSFDSDEEFYPTATKEEIDRAYYNWLDQQCGCGWEVIGKDDYISSEDYACMTKEMKEKEFPNG